MTQPGSLIHIKPVCEMSAEEINQSDQIIQGIKDLIGE